MLGLLGIKVGMTSVFGAEGEQIPVTVIEVGPCVVLQRKTRAQDGYEAVKVGFGAQKESRITKPVRGQFKASQTAPQRFIHEFTVDAGDSHKPGDTLSVSVFEGVPFVDVTGALGVRVQVARDHRVLH